MKHMPIATVIGIALLFSTGVSAADAKAADARLTARCDIRLEAQTILTLPDDMRVAGRRFGGISGMDFDPLTKRLLFVSDDRIAANEAALFASSSVDVNTNGADFGPVSSLPLRGLPADAGIDFEAVRTLPSRRGLWVASEGGADASSPAWLARFDDVGKLRWWSALPTPLDQAPHNRSIESMAFDDTGNLWVALENALPGDGPQGDATRGAALRIARLRPDSRRPPAAVDSQQVYRTEPAEPDGAAGPSDIGISEMLIVDGAWWVMERSGTASADGRYRFRSRLFCVEPATHASDQEEPASMRKTLLLDSRDALDPFDPLDPLEANLEAMTLIERPGRTPWLLIANDNNFAPGVATRVLLFEIRRR